MQLLDTKGIVEPGAIKVSDYSLLNPNNRLKVPSAVVSLVKLARTFNAN
jgi:hypothetical protein